MKATLTVLHIVLLSGLAFYGWRRERQLPRLFWPALVIKIFAGLAMGLLYWYYYCAGDTINYFRESVLMADLARTDFTAYLDFLWSSDAENLPLSTDNAPRAIFFTKIVSLFSLITGDNYWLIASYFSLFSFVGSWLLVKVVSRHVQVAVMPAVVAFLFFPSVVFWSSGVIKESLAMAALYFLSAVFLQAWFHEKVKLLNWVLTILSAWILWNLKYYFAGIFFSVVITALIFRFILEKYLRPQTWVSETGSWTIILVLALGVVSFTHPNFYPERFAEVIVENYHTYDQESNNQIHFHFPQASLLYLLINAPWALISGLYRPFMWEANNILLLLVGLENFLLVLISGAALVDIRSWRRSPFRMLIFSALVYTFLCCVFITLSTPNFGTLSRYRVAYLPYFIFLLMSSSRANMFLQRSVVILFGNPGKSTFAPH